MLIFVLLLVLDVLLWLLLVLVRAMKVPRTELSAYELERRSAAGDEAAQEAAYREELAPEIYELQYIVQAVLAVLVAVVTVGLVGPWWALLVMLVLVLQVEATARWPQLNQWAQRLYDRYEPQIFLTSVKLRPLLRRLRGSEGPRGQFVYSKQELLDRLATVTVLSAHELQLIKHGLAFDEQRVSDVMTPRSVIEAVAQQDTVGPVLLDRLHKSGHSRFPVYDGDIDHVTGMLYMHDLVPLRTAIKRVEDAMQQRVFYIRQDYDLEHALAAFLRTHHHLFVVVNEYRETVGLLSLEDVMEALLGRAIIDEFDQYHDLRAVAEKNPRHNNLPIKRKDV